ncbi:unnamed protein product [Ceutorhynchus assimilis]|uniref:Uncharacterized protein n=1 Tax=Ceutorhynchus assimilis TaxID=467358 RepID=A0A9P0DMW1_9CUCU|nr:unnamed protein product [Ceutorhynchus assimilis]
MGVDKKKNYKNKAEPTAIPKNAIKQQNISIGDPVIIPERIFRKLLNYFDGAEPAHRNVALTVKEYPVENINDRIRKTRSDPTHLVVFCLRIMASDFYNTLGVVHMNNRFEHASQLALLWVAFIQDLSKLGLNVVASVSPCTQMYRDILCQLTRDENFENCCQPITYMVYPYLILHLYDYNSIMEEFQETFHFRKDVCFISRHWAGNDSAEKVYAASWRNMYGVLAPSLGKPSYHYAERAKGVEKLIFLPPFRRNYKKASEANPSRSFTKLSTDFLLDLLWEFSRICEEESMKLDELEKFCVENQELKCMLASAHFKCSRFNEVQRENVWFSTFESKAFFKKGSYRIEFNGPVGDKGNEAFQKYVDRLAYNEDPFFDVEIITSMNKESTIITKLLNSFAENNTNKKGDKAIKESSNLIYKIDSTNPGIALSSNEAVPKKLSKKRFVASKKKENPNKNVTGTSYETFEESDIKVKVHYLDHILKPAKGHIKNYLDTFGHCTESYDNLYSYEQANTQSENMSKESQIDEISKETEGDTDTDLKRKLNAPYKKHGKFSKDPTVHINDSEILCKTISNKPVKNPNHQVPVESSGIEGSSKAASEINMDENATKLGLGESKNEKKRVSKERYSDKDIPETPISAIYKYALRKRLTVGKTSNNCQKTVSEAWAKQQSNELYVDSSRDGFKKSEDNNVDSNDTASDCLSTSEVIVDKNKNAIKEATKIRSRESKSQRGFEELAKKQNHNVPVESARNVSKISKDNNMNFKQGVSYEATLEVTVDKNAIKNAAEIPISGRKIASEKPVKNQNQELPVEVSGSKVSKDSNVDFYKTLSDSLEGKEDYKIPGFLIKPMSKLKVKTNATKSEKSEKVTENIGPSKISSEMPEKSMSLKNEIKQMDSILQSLKIDEGPPKNELFRSTLDDQRENEGQFFANSGYSKTTSIDNAFMSLNQQLSSSDQAVELIKSKQKALQNIGLDSCLPTDKLSKPAQKNENDNKEYLKPSFSGGRKKVWVGDGSCQEEISPVSFNAMETIKIEPKPDFTKEQKLLTTDQPTTVERKKAKQSDICDNKRQTEKEDLIYDLYTKDSMDNFFKCFKPKRNRQYNKVSLSFLQDVHLSSPFILESASEDAYLDPVEEENIYSGTVLETNNEESPQQHAENDEVKVIDVEEYRQLLLSDCDKQKRTCDINNVKDKETVINFFNIIPEGAEVLQITTDWLCTLKGYSKLIEILKECNVPLIRTTALCLDHMDLFVDLIREHNSERLLGQRHKFTFKELQFIQIDRDSTFEVIEREGRGSGRFEIKQDYTRDYTQYYPY